MLSGMFTSDTDKRKEAAGMLRKCGLIGEDIYLLNLPDGLERIFVKHRISWMQEMLAPESHGRGKLP